jgi:hypothetical protein
MDDLRRNERLCWGSPAEVRDALLTLAESLGSSSTRGAMQHEMFLRQIERFAAEVLPDLRRHDVARVLAA